MTASAQTAEAQLIAERALATDLLAKLRDPFPPEQVGKLPKPTSKDAPKGKCKPKSEGGAAPDWQDYFCGGYHGLPAVHLDYVGHAAVTDRLLQVDPFWNWEPVAFDEHGRPLMDLDQRGNPVGMWIRLTVNGVTRLGYGSVSAGSFDAEKQLIGDAIRNAAMRFGCALDLWVKGHGEDDEKVAAADERERPARSARHAEPPANVPGQHRECALCGGSLEGARVERHPDGWAHKGDCPQVEIPGQGALLEEGDAG